MSVSNNWPLFTASFKNVLQDQLMYGCRPYNFLVSEYKISNIYPMDRLTTHSECLCTSLLAFATNTGSIFMLVFLSLMLVTTKRDLAGNICTAVVLETVIRIVWIFLQYLVMILDRKWSDMIYLYAFSDQRLMDYIE